MGKVFSLLNLAAALLAPLYAPFIVAHPAVFGAVVAGANAVMHFIAPQLQGVKG